MHEILNPKIKINFKEKIVVFLAQKGFLTDFSNTKHLRGPLKVGKGGRGPGPSLCVKTALSTINRINCSFQPSFFINDAAYMFVKQAIKLFVSSSRTHLCRRFTVFVTKYNLMSKDNLIVPMTEGDQNPDESDA